MTALSLIQLKNNGAPQNGTQQIVSLHPNLYLYVSW